MVVLTLLLLGGLSVGPAPAVKTVGNHVAECGEPSGTDTSRPPITVTVNKIEAPGHFTVTVREDEARLLGINHDLVVLAGVAPCESDRECGFLIGELWGLIRRDSAVEVRAVGELSLAQNGEALTVTMKVPAIQVEDLAFYLLRNGYSVYDPASAIGLGRYEQCRLKEAEKLGRVERRGMWANAG